MYFLLLIVIMGFYPVLCFTTVMGSNRLVILPTIAYMISGVLFVIPFIFTPKDQNSIDNYLLALLFGIVLYGFVAINALWKKPVKVKLENLRRPTGIIENTNEDKIEEITMNLQVSKYKFYIASGTLAVLFFATKIFVTPEMRVGALESIETIFILLQFMIIVFFVIDIYIWLKNKRFVFITIKPLFVIALLIVLARFLP